MRPANLLFLLSDNHARTALGVASGGLVRTPSLDRLAARGARFANAYTASPICCPARAAIATGRYPHETGYWDNAITYDGRVPTWHHRLRAAGHHVAVVGKLHFRSGADDNGFRRVIYTSDHGEALGAQGLLGKFQLYEPSVGVPLILAGPDVPTGMVIEEPVSHIDLYPTILDSFGIDADNVPHPQSLWPMIGRGPRPGPVFAEYHAAGSHAEIFLLRKGDEKILSRHVAEIDPPREDRATGRLLRPRGEQPCPMTALR